VGLGRVNAAAFEWRCLRKDALELALTMLVRDTERRPPGLICHPFCRDAVSCLVAVGGVPTSRDAVLWRLTAFRDADASDEPGPDRPVGTGHPPAGWIRPRWRRA